MTPINFNAPWHQLKNVVVGSTYDLNFYDPIKNLKIKESLQTIARETEEDYQNLIQVLKSFDVTVTRPVVNDNKTIVDYVDVNGQINFNNAQSHTLIPRPPMQPRDSFLIVGNKLVATNDEFFLFKNLNCTIFKKIKNSFDAPLVTVVGDTIILDCRDHAFLHQQFLKLFPDYNIKPVYIGGHNDAVFSLIKPGLIVSTHHHTNYQNTFPNWKVKYIENQSWNAIPEWRKIKHSNFSKWWAPESINNFEFSKFVDTWLTNWLGFVKETVFDVNMLQIDEQYVLVNNYNRDLFDFFKKNYVEPIIVPFRHRFFWDGGLHCITNDLYREGKKESYVQ
jgi:hypothetical protein